MGKHYIALEITKISIENGAQAATTDDVGDTPLHCFLRGARYGRIDHFRSGERIVEFLLGDEASPDARNDRGETPRIIVSDWARDSCVDGYELYYGSGGNFDFYKAIGYESQFPRESLHPETEPTTTD